MPLSKQFLNFHVPDLHNIKLIGFADTSLYVGSGGVINPTLEITPPGHNKVAVPFTKGGFIVLNSNNLEMSCEKDECQLLDLPDGIWEVRYSFAPTNENFVVKTFIRTESIQKTFATAVLRTDIKQCAMDVKNEDMDVLDQAWYIIQGAIADANACNNKAAMDKYDLANKILTNFLKCH